MLPAERAVRLDPQPLADARLVVLRVAAGLQLEAVAGRQRVAANEALVRCCAVLWNGRDNKSIEVFRKENNFFTESLPICSKYCQSTKPMRRSKVDIRLKTKLVTIQVLQTYMMMGGGGVKNP